MTNYREILRLSSLGYSQRSIESSVRSSHQTVKFALERAKELNISWPIDDDITNRYCASCGRRVSDDRKEEN